MFGAPPWISSKLMNDKTEPAADLTLELTRIRPELFSWNHKAKVSLKMEEKRNRRFSLLSIISALCIFFMQGVSVQSLECYCCTDLGDGSCSENKVQKLPCSPDQNMCVETVTAIETSHYQNTVLVKGCGSGQQTRAEKAMSFNGMTVYTLVSQCNISTCNKEFEMKSFQLPPPDNSSYHANEAQCYSCIGTSKDQCTPSNSPVKQCFDSLNNCFDGNVTVTLGNTSVAIPIKSCSQNDHCAMQTFAFGAPTVEIKGACCRGNLCNQDLSNKTQYAEPPTLVLIPPPVVESNHTTAIPPNTTIPTHEQPGTNGTTKTRNDTIVEDDLDEENGSDEENKPGEASQSLISPWLLCFALVLSKL